MTGIVERLRQGWRAWKIKRQRSKLRSAYAKVGRIRYGLGPGFSPTLYAYERLTSEGLASITTDCDLIWHWPENDTAAKSGRDVCTDGGQDVTSKWTLVCTDCDWEDELVTDGHPADGPPSEVEERVRKRKGTVNWSHVVRVEGCRADSERDVDPSLLTDGGQCLSATEQAPGTLILVDHGSRETWHHSVAFDGYQHETACGQAFDCDEFDELRMDIPEWFDLNSQQRCDECAGSVRSLVPDTDRSGGDQDV